MRKYVLFLYGLLALLTPTACAPDAQLASPDTPVLDGTGFYGNAGLGNPGSIRNWTPVNLVVTVSDKEGHDLLSPEREGNYFQGATLTFLGKTYAAQEESQSGSSSSKAYEPVIFGYILVRQEPQNCLLFGEIDGSANLDEDIVLTWRDGSKDIIHYHCAKHNQKTMTCERSWQLNGKPVSGPSFALVK